MAHFVSAIDTVVDFGDLQIFEGFTTYPAIITVRRAPTANEDGQEGELRFLNIKSDVPEDLARAFRADAQAMPRARLGDGSWQLEGDRRAALRAKIKARKKTLGEVYGPPLRGIVTGLNEAFIVSRERRDELVARDARSAELLVPFLRGENIKRWRVESEDLFLINIPKGKFKIDDYPAVRDHLLPFKPALEARDEAGMVRSQKPTAPLVAESDCADDGGRCGDDGTTTRQELVHAAARAR